MGAVPIGTLVKDKDIISSSSRVMGVGEGRKKNIPLQA